jgi:hypothetical protein
MVNNNYKAKKRAANEIRMVVVFNLLRNICEKIDPSECNMKFIRQQQRAFLNTFEDDED